VVLGEAGGSNKPNMGKTKRPTTRRPLNPRHYGENRGRMLICRPLHPREGFMRYTIDPETDYDRCRTCGGRHPKYSLCHAVALPAARFYALTPNGLVIEDDNQ
jgi:hypothetical protein